MKYATIINSLMLLVLILVPMCAYAQVSVFEYELLQPLPGSETTGITLQGYIRTAYRTILALCAFLAVVKIVIGGIYITAAGGNESSFTKGREMITMALWGLLLALMAVLILQSINPQLIEGRLGTYDWPDVVPIEPPPPRVCDVRQNKACEMECLHFSGTVPYCTVTNGGFKCQCLTSDS